MSLCLDLELLRVHEDVRGVPASSKRSMEFLPSPVYFVRIWFSSAHPLSLVFWTRQKVVGSKHEREWQEGVKESPRKERSLSCCSPPTQNAGRQWPATPHQTSTRRWSSPVWRVRLGRNTCSSISFFLQTKLERESLQNEKKQWFISELDHQERREQSPHSGAVTNDSNSKTVRGPENLHSVHLYDLNLLLRQLGVPWGIRGCCARSGSFFGHARSSACCPHGFPRCVPPNEETGAKGEELFFLPMHACVWTCLYGNQKGYRHPQLQLEKGTAILSLIISTSACVRDRNLRGSISATAGCMPRSGDGYCFSFIVVDSHLLLYSHLTKNVLSYSRGIHVDTS